MADKTADDLVTSEQCLEEALRWEEVLDQPFMPGDPAPHIAKMNVEYFLDEAAKLEKEGK
jgi:hypothetical protein